MGLFGLRRDVRLVLVCADSADDSCRSDVVDAVADDAAEADSNTASAQGLHLSLILCRGHGQLRMKATHFQPERQIMVEPKSKPAKGMNECVVMVGCVGIQGEDVLRRSCFGRCQIEPNIIANLTQPCYFRPFSNSRIDSIAREGGAFFLLIVLGWEGEIVRRVDDCQILEQRRSENHIFRTKELVKIHNEYYHYARGPR